MSTRGGEALSRSLTKALGARTAGNLAKLGLETVGDLLGHYPRRYIEPGRLTDLSDLVIGERVLLMVETVSFTTRPMRNKRGSVVSVEITDGVGRMPMVFFAPHRGVVNHLERTLTPGTRVAVEGQVRLDNRGKRQLTHPDVEEVDETVTPEDLAERGPRPSYPATNAFGSGKIEVAVQALLDGLPDAELPDPVPSDVREAHGLIDHAAAIRQIHRPADTAAYRAAQRALRFEEAFVLQAAMARRRAEAAREPATARPTRADGLLAGFDADLPFGLTEGQREVGREISGDLGRATPMQRLLQGEVGSGKTVVALRAMLQTIDAGGQAALLAPTEVLAAQHHRSIAALLGVRGEGGMLGGADAATRVVLLTGSMSGAARRQALAEAASGSAGIVIGTHALLAEHVQFADLGLVVVDEQHRFGVEQRDALRAKGRTAPHLLVMTATPIPRTVAMTIFGDLEVSTLRELPAGRAPITTHVVPAENEAWVRRTWERVAEEVHAGRRAYVVCPRISDTLTEAGAELAPADDDANRRPPASVEEVAAELRGRDGLRGIEIGVLHGRLSTDEKSAAMAAFHDGRAPVLVATTVVEVGVDVPEASAMVVLDADRFGLSQLHQLRGRIGRGGLPGVCLVLTHSEPGTPARTRLETLAATTDGFELAEADLAERREGDVLGAAQHGRTNSLRLLRVVTDQDTISAAREAARRVIAADPELARHPVLAAAIAHTLDPEREEYLDRA